MYIARALLHCCCRRFKISTMIQCIGVRKQHCCVVSYTYTLYRLLSSFTLAGIFCSVYISNVPYIADTVQNFNRQHKQTKIISEKRLTALETNSKSHYRLNYRIPVQSDFQQHFRMFFFGLVIWFFFISM